MSPAAQHARFETALPDGRLQCDLCPRLCKLRPGQRGFCFVRQNSGGHITLTTYGRSSGFCIDPVEKKPLNHFLPGTPALSFGTAGCNLACRFCQNWSVSKSRRADTLADQAPPGAIARAAQQNGCRSVAFTYNDPVIFYEYAADTAAACRGLGIRTVAVTAGYVTAAARPAFFAGIDAANVDLKSFSASFYRDVCSAELGVVLDTLTFIKNETSTWLEVTTLLVPGQNDSDAELHAASAWFAENLGTDTPWHFSAFHPDWKMRHLDRTPHATLKRARSIARSYGIRYVYLGNVHDAEGDTTFCHGCGGELIKRDWYEITAWNLSPDGTCPACRTPLPGVFEPAPGDWGKKRKTVAIRPV